jgi:hypothetical protein
MNLYHLDTNRNRFYTKELIFLLEIGKTILHELGHIKALIKHPKESFFLNNFQYYLISEGIHTSDHIGHLKIEHGGIKYISPDISIIETIEIEYKKFATNRISVNNCLQHF